MSYPKHYSVGDGFVAHELSPRVLTITSKLPNAVPDWRVAYFGFERRCEGTAFLMPLAKQLSDKHGDGQHCLLRRSQRLSTPWEVKVKHLSKPQVLRLKADIEGVHIIRFIPIEKSVLVNVVVNGTTVGRLTADSKAWFEQQMTGCQTHREAIRLASSLILQGQINVA